MKRFKLELLVGLVAVLAIAWLICQGGCATARGNRTLGRVAVSVALRAGAVNEIELSLARPYLEYLERLLRAEPVDAPVILSEIVDSEIETWGAELTIEERGLVCDIVGVLLEGVEARPPTPDQVQAATTAADIVAGMIAAIDAVVPPEDGG